MHEVALDWKMAGDERVMAYLNVGGATRRVRAASAASWPARSNAQPESVRRRRISDMTVSEMVQHSAKLKRVGNELIKVCTGAHCPPVVLLSHLQQGNKFGEALQLYQAAFVVMQQAVRRISEVRSAPRAAPNSGLH